MQFRVHHNGANIVAPRTMRAIRAIRAYRITFALAIALFLLSLLPAATALAVSCPPVPPFASLSDRVGINVALDYGKSVDDYNVVFIRAGWYIDYARRYDPSTPGGMGYVQVLRMGEFAFPNWRDVIGGLIDANPGGIWVIGNEMDRNGQDQTLAAQYARIYHDAYFFIKERDPSSTVVVGAIVQPTPVRLLYLDIVLEEYEDLYGTRMPVEYWNTHGFILREAGGYGAFLPPGLGNRTELAMDWDVQDHGDVEIFKSLIVAFRTWINARGYRNTPLMVSEYGILMPSTFDAGNGQTFDYEFVRDYMLATFNYMKDTTSSTIGYPADGNRLVQAWAWYSLNDLEWNPDTQIGVNGNLFDHDTGVAKPLASDFRGFTSVGYVSQYTDVVIRELEILPSDTVTRTGGPLSIGLNASVINRGNFAAQNLRVSFYLGNPNSGGTLLGQSSLLNSLAIRCGQAADLSFTWNPGDLTAGTYPIYAVVTYQNSSLEFDASNNTANTLVTVLDAPISGLSAANDGPTQLGSPTQLIASLTNGTGVTYQWNFGDGFTGAGKQTTHTYATPGLYQATVTATNSRGSRTASTNVQVVDVPITGLSLPAQITTNLGSNTSFAATIQTGTNVTYEWDFGDGKTGTGRTPTHLYTEPGDYQVTVTATNGSSSAQTTTIVHILDIAVSGLTAINNSPTPLGAATQFHAQVSGGTNVSYSWNFGDGALGTGANPTHVYAAIGTYIATVTASNGTNSRQTTTIVDVTDVGLFGLSASNDGPTELGDPTQLTATIQRGTNVVYSWDFGDGSSGAGRTPTHIYGTVDRYTATVTATNDAGSMTARTFVQILDVPISGLKATSTGIYKLGQPISFAGSVTGGTNARYSWDFGDGAQGQGANPTHTYDLPGIYQVTLVATNSRGSKQTTITVTIGDCEPEIEVVVGDNDAMITITWCRKPDDSQHQFTLWRIDDSGQAVQIPIEFLGFDGDKEVYQIIDTLADLTGGSPALYQYEIRTPDPDTSFISAKYLLTPPSGGVFLPVIAR